MKKVVISCLVFSSVLAFLYCKYSEKKSAPKTQIIIPQNQEKKLQELIEKAEFGFSHLENMLRPVFEKISDDNFRQQLMLPFLVLFLNQKNPYKNYYAFLKTKRPGEKTAELEDPNFFFYAINDTPGLASAFSPSTRILHLDPHIESKNIFDMLVLYHELIHVSQDNTERMGIQTREDLEAFNAFYTAGPGEKQRVIINSEATAIAYELEILNLLFKGGLKNSVHLEHDVLTRQIQREFSLRENQLALVNLLAALARKYWPTGLSQGNFDKAFFREVAKHYEEAGYDIFVLIGPRMVKQVSPEEL